MYNLWNKAISPKIIDFLALNLALAESKFFYDNYLALNNLASYLLHPLTYLIFLANLDFKTAIYLYNYSFLLANALLSFSKNDLMVANA